MLSRDIVHFISGPFTLFQVTFASGSRRWALETRQGCDFDLSRGNRAAPRAFLVGKRSYLDSVEFSMMIYVVVPFESGGF